MSRLSPKDKKLLSDPDWRLDNLYKIKDKNKRIIRFQKNEIQQRLHDESTRFDVILKSRQVGISTYYLLKKLDRTIFTPNYTTCILSHKRESMEKLFAIIRRAHKYLHPKIQPVLDKGGGSKYELRFPEIDSKIYCTMEAVSDTVNDLHISEMALMENDERVYISMDAVPMDSGVISIETTPRGFNHFHKFWIDQESIFKKHFFPWYMHGEYRIEDIGEIRFTEDEMALVEKAHNLYNVDITKEQIAFRRAKIKQRKQGDKKSFLREYPEDDKSCFIGSGDSPFDLEHITKLQRKMDQPILKTDTMEIYEEVRSNRNYVCAADTSEGKGGDYSVATIYEIESMKQVAQIRSNYWKPSQFAQEINDLCMRYMRPNGELPLLAVEINNHGHAVLLKLEETIQYPHLYEYKDGTKGWLTNAVTRPIMIDTFIEALEEDMMQISSADTLNECLTLVNKKGKIEAEDGEHDDCIIASAIAIQLCIMKKSEAQLYDNLSEKILI